MDYSFLKKYVRGTNSEKCMHLKHTFYEVNTENIKKVEQEIYIPSELKVFWEQIGYGFFYNNSNSIDRLLGPNDYKLINLGLEYYEFDPHSEFFRSNYDKLIFLEVNEGVFLTIDKQLINGTNSIYYFEEKIANSLEEFLIRFDLEGHYFEGK